MASIKLYTPKFRVSFPDVFKATQINGQGAEKFRISMIFDPAEIAKDPEEQVKWDAIKAAVKQAAVDKFGSEPAEYKKPFKKGDDMKNKETGKVYEGHEGMIILRAQSNDRPGLVDAACEPIMDQSEFYGGCYAKATFNFYAWDHPTQGKGVSAGIQNIMKVAEGETFSGKTKAEDDFTPIAKAAATAEATADSDLF